jgi:hypothetical protein
LPNLSFCAALNATTAMVVSWTPAVMYGLDISRHRHLHAQLVTHLVGVTLDGRQISPTHEYAPEIAHQPEPAHLEAGRDGAGCRLAPPVAC